MGTLTSALSGSGSGSGPVPVLPVPLWPSVCPFRLRRVSALFVVCCCVTCVLCFSLILAGPINVQQDTRGSRAAFPLTTRCLALLRARL